MCLRYAVNSSNWNDAHGVTLKIKKQCVDFSRVGESVIYQLFVMFSQQFENEPRLHVGYIIIFILSKNRTSSNQINIFLSFFFFRFF